MNRKKLKVIEIDLKGLKDCPTMLIGKKSFYVVKLPIQVREIKQILIVDEHGDVIGGSVSKLEYVEFREEE